MSHDELSQIKNLITQLDEKMIQQRSANHSDILKQIQSIEKKLDERMDALEKELASWKLASKIGVTVLVAIGAIVTWVVDLVGVKIGFKL